MSFEEEEDEEAGEKKEGAIQGFTGFLFLGRWEKRESSEQFSPSRIKERKGKSEERIHIVKQPEEIERGWWKTRKEKKDKGGVWRQTMS